MLLLEINFEGGSNAAFGQVYGLLGRIFGQ
jgi:hypothetical protein